MVACDFQHGIVSDPGDTTTLQLNRLSNGDLQYCDDNGECTDLPYDGSCATIYIDVNTATGQTCERCVLDNGTVVDEGCGAGSSVACVLVTLPDPDCVVCAYVDGSVIFSTCNPQEPDQCAGYMRRDGLSCEKCWDSAGNLVFDSCGPDCTNVGCPAVECPPGTEYLYIPDECCGQCLPIDGCDEVVCSSHFALPDCPPDTTLVRNPADCCGYICEPNACPAAPTDNPDSGGSSSGGSSEVPVQPCVSGVDCPAGAFCIDGLCIYDDAALCPPGYWWDDSYPTCGRCVLDDPNPEDYCFTTEDCELAFGAEYYCAFDEGTCAGAGSDPAGGDLWACLGICRPRDPVCDNTTQPG
ncbi:MAG: hypothetical protein V3T05_00255, partial [Myxococcota bacterium]